MDSPEWTALKARWKERDACYSLRSAGTIGPLSAAETAVRTWRTSEAEALKEPERSEAVAIASVWSPPWVTIRRRP